MKSNLLRDLMHRINETTIATKTTLLFFIMLTGMLFIGSFAHMSINRIKNNFDILYTKRMLPTIRLENLKDIYTVNVLDTIRDIEKGLISASEGQVIILLAQELIQIELQEYKKSLEIDESDWLVKLARSWGVLKPKTQEYWRMEEHGFMFKIEQKIHTIDGILLKMFRYFDSNQPFKAIEILQNELYPSVYSINIDLTGLINQNLKNAKEGFLQTEIVYDNTFEWIVLATVGTTLVAGLLALLLLRNIRLLHSKLANVIDEKTKELQKLNDDLKEKVRYEVEQSRQKDQIMFRQSRLASMGEMIGNIAHQWRQPLSAMVLILQSFQMKRMAGIELSDAFIEKQVNEGMALGTLMSNTIDDFRNFFKPNQSEEPFSLKETVTYSVKLIKAYYAKAGIKILITCKNDSIVQGYPNEFSQVMMNLLSNAKDAFEERDSEEKYIEIVISKEANTGVIWVIDNAGGMSEEVQDRIFEPYFTTKHKSTGTGIGLYMSKQIIEKQMTGSIGASNSSYTFSNGKFYEKCMIMTIVMPIVEKEEEA
ncbi:ATP-binding protein [Sulfurospirillum barnesii]|uniref:histidine kinase n=1 Tax=Sulfurospirillum barnesii (strain ATCC 700032 / DSM 10660 / SES-3) TaxID=760154 RepID=I3XU37_SULBS|nr:ATP-binding protein [Sulfurospirillum barnesii]AFL67461.1 histidine kinase [Sulfurospirillum barnesii SES-3]